MNNLTTRKIVLGMLMTLVLAFSVQSTADALRFTSQITRTDRPNVSFVYPNQTFDLRFTVSLVTAEKKDPTATQGTSTDISYASEDSTRSLVSVTIIKDTGYTAGVTTHYTVSTATDSTTNDGISLITQTRTWTNDSTAAGAVTGNSTDISYALGSRSRPPVSATRTLDDTDDYTAGDTHYTVSTATEETTISGVRLTTHTRTWMTEAEAYYYNEEAVTITPGADISIVSINGYTVNGAAGTSYELNEDEDWGGTTTSELSNTTISVRFQAGTILGQAAANQISVSDTTIAATTAGADEDYPRNDPRATPPTSSPFQITVVQRIPPVATNIPDLSSVSAASIIRAHETRTPITVTLTGGTSPNWYEVDFAIASGSSGRLSEKQDGTGNTGTSLTAYTNGSATATVYLNPSGSTTKVQVTVAGRSPGSTTSTHSQTVTIFYQSFNLEADLTIDGPGGNDQSGIVDTRLANPFVVKVTDGTNRTNRGISGQAVTFTPAGANPGTGNALFPYSNFRAESTSTPVTAGTPTDGYNPLVVKTDNSGEAKVYFELGSAIGAYTVNATFSGITRTFTATALSATTTRVLRVDTEDSVQEQSVARLTTASKPLVVRVLAGGVSELSGQSVRFTTTDGDLSPRREATQLTDGTIVPNLPHDITILTNGEGEAWIDYTAGNTEGPVTIYARAYTHISGTSFTRIDSANTVIFRVNVGGSTIRPPADEDDDEDEDEDVPSVTIDVPRTVTGTAGGTTTLRVTAPANARVTAGRLNDSFLSTNVGSFTRSGTTFTSTLTLPNQVTSYSLTVFVGNTSYPVTVSTTAAAVQTGTLTVRVEPLTGAPGSTATVTVTAADASAQPASVTVNLTATGGTLSSSSVATGTTGTTTVTLTRGSTVGSENFVTVSGPSGYPSVSGRFVIAGPAPRDMTVGAAAEVDVYDGNNQDGSLNSRLAEPFIVEVVDANDNPVEDARVRFRTTIGSGRFSPRTPRTDEDGFAETTFTPTSAGRIRVVATVAGADSTAAFIVQGGEPADALEKVSGDNQSGTPGNALANPFVVEVQDEDGEPLTGHSVTFSVTAGGGSLSETSATADEDGRAETTLTLGSAPGINSVQASVSGADPVTFSTSIDAKILVAAANRPMMSWIAGGALYSLSGAKEAKIAEGANGVAVGGGKIYWTEMTGESGGTVNSANLNGTDVTELASIFATPIGIAVDAAGSKLYWTNASGRIQSANLDGSGIKNVLQNLSGPTDIVVSNGFIYWTEGGNSVRRVNISGQKIAIDVAVNLGTVGGLAVGGGKVYWTEQTSASAGTVNGANLNGTNFETLATLLSAPMGISVDTAGSKLYWTNARGRVQSANLDGSGIKNVVEGLISASKIAIGGANTETTTVKAATPAKKNNAKYDVNGDGKVDNVDASLVASGLDTGNAKYDVNSDGTVNFLDLLLVFENRDEDAAAAPAIVGMKLNAVQIDRIEEQIDLLIATNDRSPAALRTLVYLQQLLATARPEKTQLFANYPNPFNPETWIPYELATDTHVRLTIYNTQGVVIRTLEFGHQSAGYYTDRDRAAYWDGRNALGEQVASGLYFYQLETDEMSSMRKMVILK